ncbi:Os05g0501900 [Oryza sativa Japonica Group]|uniref:Os05g0501900 protein n=1 Tax=Oryza sativa subsp. japonica TaxID=39947 RepID=A0A0P0WPB8_ORYSJ|nr:Os05g0501900 [Oryza sativa Japonica Group]
MPEIGRDGERGWRWGEEGERSGAPGSAPPATGGQRRRLPPPPRALLAVGRLHPSEDDDDDDCRLRPMRRSPSRPGCRGRRGRALIDDEQGRPAVASRVR